MVAIEDPFTYKIIGALMEVHTVLGPGYLERVYQEAAAIELTDRGIPFVQEAEMPVWYRDELLDAKYRVDFLCNDEVLVELKALPFIGDIEKAQVLNYLRASRKSVALLVNFGADSLEWRRFLYKWPGTADQSGSRSNSPPNDTSPS
ncbi:MAG TPA: GxxExxY protein [Candidatus Thermoplasmatota archaeon]|nr:GxxExxY protein [Candidatus Thermoplasmatota archaeon]